MGMQKSLNDIITGAIMFSNAFADTGGGGSTSNPYKHHKKGERNQRQWRKWLRANPSMRRSKHGK